MWFSLAAVRSLNLMHALYTLKAKLVQCNLSQYLTEKPLQVGKMEHKRKRFCILSFRKHANIWNLPISSLIISPERRFRHSSATRWALWYWWEACKEAAGNVVVLTSLLQAAGSAETSPGGSGAAPGAFQSSPIPKLHSRVLGNNETKIPLS